MCKKPILAKSITLILTATLLSSAIFLTGCMEKKEIGKINSVSFSTDLEKETSEYNSMFNKTKNNLYKTKNEKYSFNMKENYLGSIKYPVPSHWEKKKETYNTTMYISSENDYDLPSISLIVTTLPQALRHSSADACGHKLSISNCMKAFEVQETNIPFEFYLDGGLYEKKRFSGDEHNYFDQNMITKYGENKVLQKEISNVAYAAKGYSLEKDKVTILENYILVNDVPTKFSIVTKTKEKKKAKELIDFILTNSEYLVEDGIEFNKSTHLNKYEKTTFNVPSTFEEVCKNEEDVVIYRSGFNSDKPFPNTSMGLILIDEPFPNEITSYFAEDMINSFIIDYMFEDYSYDDFKGNIVYCDEFKESKESTKSKKVYLAKGSINIFKKERIVGNITSGDWYHVFMKITQTKDYTEILYVFGEPTKNKTLDKLFNKMIK